VLARFAQVGLLCLAGVVPPRTVAAAVWPRIALGDSITGLSQPVHIADSGDGSGRLFVVQQGGMIRLVKNGGLQAAPFLDIRSRVSCCGERGLLSVAFPPGYASKAHFYVYYTDVNGNIVLARYGLTADADVADASSEQTVLTIDHPTYSNHNGGQLVFGPNDGYLYMGTGDGGGAGDPHGNGQNTDALLGKLLRLDVEAGTATYAVPPTNAFVGQAGFRPEIWAFGLRNPWRFSFDRDTADVFIADVGQGSYEEINFQPATDAGGRNYGWNIMEGFHCYNAATCNSTGLTLPVSEYDHSQGDCAVTGGFVYRGAQFARLRGIYFYGDYCSGRIRGLQLTPIGWESAVLSDTGFQITGFGQDEAGEIYVADYTNGAITHLVGAACVGDCKGDGTVSVDELLTMANVALGNADVSACSLGDANGDHQITVDEILTAVYNAQTGCP
jgi:glucose/arabinose dehydrogenase